MNYYLAIIFSLLVLLFIYSQIRVHRKYQTDYQILQVSDPEKDVLEQTLRQKYPTVLTDVVISWKDIRNLTPELVQKKGNALLSDPKFIKILDKYLGYYHMPLTISKYYTLKHHNIGDTQYITKQTNFRFYAIQIYGKSRFILFSPNEAKYLYPTKDGNVSNINFWKLDYWETQINSTKSDSDKKNIETKRTEYLDKYSKFNKAKYIELILHQGQILYIPYMWWFTSYSTTEGIQMTATSRSLFSW